MHRDVDEGSPLAGAVSRDAFSGIVEGRVRWAGGRYDASAHVGFTHVRGDSGAILELQRSSRRYWQRPDASHVEIDPRRLTLSGTMLGINHSKLAGAHWLWDIDYWQEAPGLEPNDIGAFGSVDDRGVAWDLIYRETRPKGWYRSYSMAIGSSVEWNFDGVRRGSEAFLEFNTTFANYLRFGSDFWHNPRGYSDDLTRGGPLMGTGRAWGMAFELEGREGARTAWSVELDGEREEFEWMVGRAAGRLQLPSGDTVGDQRQPQLGAGRGPAAIRDDAG